MEREESGANMGFIAAIVAVATIGGLLFGYDSGAVNGTQDGLRQAFDLSDGGLGFTVGSLLIGCFIGALLMALVANYAGFLAPKVALVSNIILMIAILLWRPAGLYSKMRG